MLLPHTTTHTRCSAVPYNAEERHEKWVHIDPTMRLPFNQGLQSKALLHLTILSGERIPSDGSSEPQFEEVREDADMVRQQRWHMKSGESDRRFSWSVESDFLITLWCSVPRLWAIV